MGRLREKEAAKRDRFKRSVERYIPTAVLTNMGLLAPPPHCQVAHSHHTVANPEPMLGARSSSLAWNNSSSRSHVISKWLAPSPSVAPDASCGCCACPRQARSSHRSQAPMRMLQVSVPPLEAGLLQVTLDDLRRLPAPEQARGTGHTD